MALSIGAGHAAFSIPAGGVAPSWLDDLWPPICVFSLSLTACPCLTVLLAADTFFGFWEEGPLAGTAIEDYELVDEGD